MKQIKILGVLAIALTLGLAACNGGGNDKKSSGAETSSKHEHTFDTTKWEADDNYHWHPATCEHTNQKGDRAAHDFGDPYDVVAATCENAGSQKVKCKICNKEVTQTIQALGHDWVDDEAGAVAATCTEAGSKNQTCSRCGAKQEGVVIDALGHDYGEWTPVEGKGPTCDKAGLEQHVCSRCGNVETQEAAALGHDTELIGGETTAPAGEAAVRLYRCKRCGVEFLGFKADEPSADSLPHLMVGDNGGMRFFGRPIGNALALDANGTSVNQSNNECVYCSTETGDFFEYIFTLNKEQADTLATCRLYCDARPADHLSGDFWAYGRSATDWTPGYYIDGADEHVQHNEDGTVMMVKDHARAVSVSAEDRSQPEGAELENEVPMGARIEDFRYVLYVDGEIKQLDSSISVPAEGSSTNMVRKEYVLPYTFHLHEGQNKISLRMAGGYRSEFYNFIFRPYVEPTPVVVNEESLTIVEGKTAQITSEMTGLEYRSSSNSVCTVDENGLVTGVKAGTATITVSKEGNYKDAKVAVTVTEKEGVINVDISKGVVAPDGGIEIYTSQGGNGTRLRNFTKDASITFTFESTVAGSFDIQLRGSQGGDDISQTIAVKVNSADVTISGALGGSTYSPVELVIGQGTLKVGENNLVITVVAETTSLVINGIKLMPHA